MSHECLRTKFRSGTGDVFSAREDASTSSKSTNSLETGAVIYILQDSYVT